MTDRSDKSEGPTAGTETADPLEFLARVLVHIPAKGHVTTRYDGCYANRPRGMRRRAEPAAAGAPSAIVPAPRLAPPEASRRWAALLQQIFEVDPLACEEDAYCRRHYRQDCVLVLVAQVRPSTNRQQCDITGDRAFRRDSLARTQSVQRTAQHKRETPLTRGFLHVRHIPPS